MNPFQTMKSITAISLIASFTACSSLNGTEGPALSPLALCLLPAPLGNWNTRIYGTSAHDGADDIHTDNDVCAIYIAGNTGGALQGFQQGQADAFVTRYSTNGLVVWARQLGTSGADRTHGVATDADHNVYVTGYTSGQLPLSPDTHKGLEDVFVAKFDQNGTHLWTRQFGSTGNDRANGIAVNAQGKVFITGEARGALSGAVAPGSIYQGQADLFMAKFDTNGNPLVTELYGTSADDMGEGIALGPSGNVYIVGRTRDDLPRATLGFFDPNNTHQGAQDLFVGKYDGNTGAQTWIRQRGTSDDDGALDVAVNADNQVFVTGWVKGALDGNLYRGYEDIVTLRYDTDGTWVWTDQRGTIYNERGQGVTVDASGTPFVTGYTFGGLDGQPYGGGSNADGVLMKYSKAGAWRWTRLFGDSGTERGLGVAWGVSDHLYMTGFASSGFGGASGLGLNDVFTVKYDQSGVQR